MDNPITPPACAALSVVILIKNVFVAPMVIVGVDVRSVLLTITMERKQETALSSP